VLFSIVLIIIASLQPPDVIPLRPAMLGCLQLTACNQCVRSVHDCRYATRIVLHVTAFIMPCPSLPGLSVLGWSQLVCKQEALRCRCHA